MAWRIGGWRSPRILGLALLVSLGLNLFLGGILGGRLLHHEGPGQRMLAGLEHVVDRLPAGEREKLQAALRDNRPKSEADLQAMRAARARIRDILRTEPLDEAALGAAFQEIQQRMVALQERVNALIAQAARSLPVEDRRKLLDR